MAAGSLVDYVELSSLVATFPALELFPIPRGISTEHDGLGIALPSSRVDEGVDQVIHLIRTLWRSHLKVFDLYTGGTIESESDLTELAERLRG